MLFGKEVFRNTWHLPGLLKYAGLENAEIHSQNWRHILQPMVILQTFLQTLG